MISCLHFIFNVIFFYCFVFMYKETMASQVSRGGGGKPLPTFVRRERAARGRVIIRTEGCNGQVRVDQSPPPPPSDAAPLRHLNGHCAFQNARGSRREGRGTFTDIDLRDVFYREISISVVPVLEGSLHRSIDSNLSGTRNFSRIHDEQI